MIDATRKRQNQLNKLRKYCTQYGIILIFDEVITGLRFDSGSVSAKWNIHPDIICCGKAFGNGHKAGFVAGDKEILDGNYFVSGTYFAHIPTLKAIETSIDLSRETRYKSERLNERSLIFVERFNELSDKVKIEAWGCRGNFVGKFEDVSLFRQELAKCRIFTKNTVVFNHCSIDSSDDILSISKLIFERIGRNEVSMCCPYPEQPLAQKVREQNA
jgi:glutamate-1-semialdehyde aminotransferase